MSLLLNLVWVLKLSAWIALFVFAVRNRLIPRYPLVFAYIFWTIGRGCLMQTAAAQLSALAYAYCYVVSSLLSIVFAAIVVLSICFQLRPFSWRHDWHLLAAPLAIALVAFSDASEMWLPARLLNIGYAGLTYLGVAALLRMVRTRDVDLGWNLKMVLFALTVPAGLFTCAFMAYTIGLPVSYETTNLWAKGASLVFWIILAVGMMEYSPPGKVVTVASVAEEAAAGGFGGKNETSTENLENHADAVPSHVRLWRDRLRPGVVAMGDHDGPAARPHRSRH